MNLFGDDTPAPDDSADALFGMEEPAVAFGAAEPEGLKPPRENALLFGHDKIEAKLLELYNAERFPHGIILSGPRGIGKATLAFRLARFLLSRTITDPNQNSMFGDDAPQAAAETLALDPDHPAFRRVASAGHADLITIERALDKSGNQKSTLDVAQLRKVAPFLRMTASSGGWRVVVIDDADMMNRNAQNALLKILEEPPKNTVLILVTHRLGTLIPTIRSRTQTFTLNAPPIGDFQKILALKNHHFGGTELEALFALSGGAVGRALSLVEEGGLDQMGQIIDLFNGYPNFDNSKIHNLASELARKGKDTNFKNFQNIMCWIAEQMLFAKARGMALPAGPMEQDCFANIMSDHSLEQLIQLSEQLSDHFNKVNHANLEKRFAVLAAFAMFCAQ